MADYTMMLKDLFTPNRFGHSYFTRAEVESWFMDYELSDYLTADQIQKIEEAGMWSKAKLAAKIVDHYYMREIGYETPALFKHFAKIKMQEVMEYQLPVVYSNSLEYDPLESVLFDITEERKIKGKGTSESQSSSSGNGISINSDTPQGRVSKSEIMSGKYASNTNSSESETGARGTTDSESETTEEFKHHEQGNKGVLDSYQKMLVDYRKSLVAVDKEIIAQLNDLFMGIY